jgi:hypothetical protein
MGKKLIFVGNLIDSTGGLELYDNKTQNSENLGEKIRRELMYGKEIPILNKDKTIDRYVSTEINYSPEKKYKITVEEL